MSAEVSDIREGRRRTAPLHSEELERRLLAAALLGDVEMQRSARPRLFADARRAEIARTLQRHVAEGWPTGAAEIGERLRDGGIDAMRELAAILDAYSPEVPFDYTVERLTELATLRHARESLQTALRAVTDPSLSAKDRLAAISLAVVDALEGGA